MRLRGAIPGLALLLSSCAVARPAPYAPELFTPVPLEPAGAVDGSALVLTTPEQDAYTFVGRPTSFVGSALEVHLPLGLQTREAARRVFDRAFRGGAQASADSSAAGGHRIVVTPAVAGFSHRYAAMGEWIVFELSLRAVVRSGSGDLILDRSYASGECGFYNDGQQVSFSYAVQWVLQDVLARVAVDVGRCLTKPACPDSTAAPRKATVVPPRRLLTIPPG